MYINRTDNQLVRESIKPTRGRRGQSNGFNDTLSSVAEIDVVHISEEEKRKQQPKQQKRQKKQAEENAAPSTHSLDIKA